MLDYGWGTPSSTILTPEENSGTESETRQVFDPYAAAVNFSDAHGFVSPEAHSSHFAALHHNHPLHFQHPQSNAHLQGFYSGVPYGSQQHPPAAPLTLEPEYMVVPKSEPPGSGTGTGGGYEFSGEFNSRIGLNLGGRTYFASTDDDFVSRLYRRSRIFDSVAVNAPRCQAEGCNADLTHAKHYHRRHKVCEFHSKAATVIAAGTTQRFCQQCSRFHVLSEFDNGKRSCRKRLADHNRRRRKSHQSNQESTASKTLAENAASTPNSSSENLSRSPPDSGLHSTSSVTVAISPPRMSLDCFPYHSSYGGATSSPASTFYSNR
ncbi:hypothetical protein M569_00920 [Genlisea aurea]|uniref:SBP-type domain-containing protein n=1 Tax=Genlisea aurea TaxID=192259 RepID=S8D8Y8_9LAMI|nr:hypothetical protein M569_00920 [Genlisea aurea]